MREQSTKTVAYCTSPVLADEADWSDLQACGCERCSAEMQYRLVTNRG
jgi:hypothetical protein